VTQRDERQGPGVDWVAIVTMLATVALLVFDVLHGLT
jgi:hypothetical protein